MPDPRHFTTRRGFIAALGFGAVSLYGAWAAYGAAPLPFGRKPTDPPTAKADPGGHGEHGGDTTPARHEAGQSQAPLSAEAFRAAHAAFLARFGRSDGSVVPVAGPTIPDAGDHSQGMDTHGTEDMAGMAGMADHGAGGATSASAVPVDVYLLAQRFAFSPDHLVLQAGRPYRFRMMADDIPHGASIQLGIASHIIRLRPGLVSDQILTFTRPGENLLYCTVYCGPGHDAMHGKITVTEGRAP